MKITILANHDIASNYAINMLLPLLANDEVSLFLSSQVGSNKNKPQPLLSLMRVEQQLFNDTLSGLLDGELSHKAKFKSFEGLSKLLCSPVLILNNINTLEGIKKLKQTAPDLIISIRYGIILKEVIIGIPRFGVINLHSGLLPTYRGVMATFWALMNNDRTIGCTLHYIDNNQIDTGRTIAITGLTVEQKHSYLWHVLTLYEQGVVEIARTVKKITARELINSSAQKSGGHYYTFPTIQDLRNFKSKGLVLADKREIRHFFHTRYLFTD